MSPAGAHENMIERTGWPSATPAGRFNWPLHTGFVTAFLAFIGFYATTFISLVSIWAHTGTFEYAFLIFPACAVLVWMRREHLRYLSGNCEPKGLIGIAGLCLLWLLGVLTDLNVVQHFTIVALVPALVYTFYGPTVTRALLFPLAYLFFAVPFGNFMVGPLQDITAHLSVFALRFTDIPVLFSGRMIVTPASAWHVAEACSGVRFFVATTAFGVLYANLFFQKLSRRLIFVAFAMIVPVIANGLRVFFTILIGENFGVEYATGTDHMIFGWQFFGAVLVLLFFSGWPWHEMAPRGMAPTQTPRIASRKSTIGVTLVTMVVLAAAPACVMALRALTTPTQTTQLTRASRLAGLARIARVPTRDRGLHIAQPAMHARGY